MAFARQWCALTWFLSLASCPEPKKLEGFPDSYAGIGIELTVAGDEVTVVRTIRGGPSEAAGVQAGDQITAINGRTTTGMSLGEAVTRLRGKPGSQLTLGISRKGSKLIIVLRRSKLAKKGKGYRAQE